MISISGMRELTQYLSNLDLAAASPTGLVRAANVIEQSVRQTVDDSDGPYELSVSISEGRAVIGSADPGAPDIELGSRANHPRPVMAQAALVVGDDVAAIVGDGFVEALRGG